MGVKGEIQPGSGKGVCAVTGDAVHCKQAASGGIEGAGGLKGGTRALTPR